MKKSEIIFSSILVPIDYALVVLAGVSAYFLRYSQIYQRYVREVVFSLSFNQYFKFVLWLAMLWIIIFALSGLFAMRPNKKIFDVLNKIFLACSTGTLVVILIFFFSRELFSSRFIILAAWGLSIVYVSLAHLIVRLIQKLFYRRAVGAHKVILVGRNDVQESLIREFKQNPSLGYRVIFTAPDLNDELINRIKELAAQEAVDELVQTDPNFSREETLKLMDLANEHHLDFKYVADLLGASRTNIDIRTINGIPIIEIKKTPLDGWGRVAKRFFDIVSSILALIIFSPLFLIVPWLIKIDSTGPVLYHDERIGAKGKKFKLHKFRSMIQGADKIKEQLIPGNERADGPLFKITHDPRITRVGKFIRRTSLDELPNFWNVLMGHLSLVGPRPHEAHEVAHYEKHHKKLLNIKPGITGLAQISGRSQLDFETEVRLDTLYIETWSLKLDLIILIKTPWVVLFGRTAA